MALSAKYFTFTKATGTGTQTVTGVGFTGKALILWTTWLLAAGTTTASELCIGITDGTRQSVR